MHQLELNADTIKMGIIIIFVLIINYCHYSKVVTIKVVGFNQVNMNYPDIHVYCIMYFIV